MDKGNFTIPKSFYDQVSGLSDKQSGKLFKAILKYQLGLKFKVGNDIQSAFDSIKAQFDMDDIKQKKVVERNRNNGSKGGRPSIKHDNDNNPVGYQKKNPVGFQNEQFLNSENERFEASIKIDLFEIEEVKCDDAKPSGLSEKKPSGFSKNALILLDDDSKSDVFKEQKSKKIRLKKDKVEKVQKVTHKARLIFEEFYIKAFENPYYWTAKDSSSMKLLLDKIIFARSKKELPVDDESVLNAFGLLLSCINDKWVKENFSVCIINSKYNEIITKIKNGTNQESGSEKQRANEYAFRQYLNFRQEVEQGMDTEMERPF